MSASSPSPERPRLTMAVTQMKCTWDRMANIAEADRLVRAAHAKGAQLILLQELFETPYFCADQKEEHFAIAQPVTNNPLLAHFAALARELQVVLPISFFERAGTVYYNSIAIIDSDGAVLGTYRKTHIPQGPGYEEKFYFTPGNTGFKVWETKLGVKIGVGICWDQWFPEMARAMVLEGAEVLLYPTAIGSEPDMPNYDSKNHWQRTMIGHACANQVPVMASNRIGSETEGPGLTFYGSSFIADGAGEKIAELTRTDADVAVASVDLAKLQMTRAAWGMFRDRRPEMYKTITASPQ